MRKMRPAVIIVIGVLIAALVALGVAYDGDYRAAWDKVDHELEAWWGNGGR